MTKCENGTPALNLECPDSGDFWIDTQMGPMTLCWPCYQIDEDRNLALIREEIAKEIEAIQISKPTMASQFGYIEAIKDAIAIVRGTQ